MRSYERVGIRPLAVDPGARQPGPGAALAGDLWMIDHAGSTVLRCRCLEASATGMRLCVPAGYGVAVGQRYELCGRVPGERPPAVLQAIATSWVTVVQTQIMTGGDADRLDVGVAADRVELTPLCTAGPVAARGAFSTRRAPTAFRVAWRHWKHPAAVGPGAGHRREVALGST